VLGVPMSTGDTGAAQLSRLVRAGLRVHWMRTLLDVDTAADATAVASQVPGSRFAIALRAMTGRLPSPAPAGPVQAGPPRVQPTAAVPVAAVP
jgi:uncharacterized protein